MTFYKKFEERSFDRQYRTLLGEIIDEGQLVQTQQQEPARMIVGHQMRFELKNGFPLITERDLASGGERSVFQQAIAELCAFLNGARTEKELESFGCFWWKRWVTEEKCRKRGLEVGDLGPGSYGPAWRNFPTGERPFDQIRHLIEQIKELPHLRTHFVSPWIPQYVGRGKGKVQKVVVAPCHGWFHVMVNPETKELSVHHFQRSADAPVGLPANLIQYGALTLVLAQVTGLTAKELVYTISDAHIYDGQKKDVEEMFQTPNERLPTVTLDPELTDIFSFRPHHFQVSDYYPKLERRVIWTPV